MTAGCALSPAPPTRPVIWAVAGDDGRWHPAHTTTGALLCDHGYRIVPGEPPCATPRVHPTAGVARRWAVTTSSSERCAFRLWPGPPGGVGATPERPAPLAFTGAAMLPREVWLDLLSVQGHRCAACRGIPAVIDADPSGMVRGLLCRRCRHVLKTCEHRPPCLGEYLDKPPARARGWRLP